MSAPQRRAANSWIGRFVAGNDVQAYVWKCAARMASHYRLPPDELFQEGVLAILVRHRKGQPRRHILANAVYGMRAFARKEMNERRKLRELSESWPLRKTSRTFEEVYTYLDDLPKEDRRLFMLWLDGKSLRAIGKLVGKPHTTVKRAINRIAADIAKHFGGKLRVECLWPVINRGLPTGIKFQDGKFMARAGHAGRVYLGIFDTVEAAVSARTSWVSANSTPSSQEGG